MARVLGKQLAKPLSLHSKNQKPCTHSQQSKLGSGIQDFHSHGPGQTAAPEAVKAPGLSGIGAPQIDRRLMSGVAGKTDADHYSFGPGQVLNSMNYQSGPYGQDHRFWMAMPAM